MNDLVYIKRALKVLAGMAGFGVLMLLTSLSPVNCMLRDLTGIPCPSCGMTRAAISLLQFDFRAAFYYHPLCYFLVVAVVYIFGLYIVKGVSPLAKRHLWVYITTLVVFIAVWLVRLIFFKVP